jgi:predicted NBD/HSP70 family sugar kinase
MKELIKPELDPLFQPAVIWNREYEAQTLVLPDSPEITLALIRPDETCSVYKTKILPPTDANKNISLRYIERILKFLLWQRGGCKVLVAGCDELAKMLSDIYSENGTRHFDHKFFGEKVYGQPLVISACSIEDIPDANEVTIPLGRHLEGCRIGFDLGGSDRKCAAVIDGKVVFSEEIEWNPYFETDPEYHIAGVNDTLKRAAEHLPRVDAIGGSSAGVYVNNEVRVASLFRGVSPNDFESKVRRMFFDLKKEWNNIPFEVVNDGEVTALAGSMSIGENAVLGIAMGTSQAAGYVTPDGNITPWLNELAFAPVDYRNDAPADEWSGDEGCGVQYFSQQAVARLSPLAGIELPEDMPFAEQLIEVQKLMKEGHSGAEKIYSTIGTYFGYAIADYADFYEIKNLMVLGRVSSGNGGEVILDKAKEVLRVEFPELEEKIEFHIPDEKMKRHGQAVAAASLPEG